MYKNNSRDSSKFKGCCPLQFSCNLTRKYHAVGYYSYTNRSTQANIILNIVVIKMSLRKIARNYPFKQIISQIKR